MEEMGLRIEIWSGWCRQCDTAKLKFCIFEIEDQPNLKTGGPKVVQHPADFVIRNSINRFGIHHNLSEYNKIGNVFSDFGIPVNDWIARLLSERNIVIPEIDNKSLLIGLLMVSMPHSIQNGKRTADNSLGLCHMNPISPICVHPVNLWLNFFRPATDRQVGGVGR